MKKMLTTLTIASLLLPAIASAEMSKEEIAKASQNPLTAMYSLPIQNNTYFGIGPDNQTKNVANIQPVLPFDISDDYTLVTRTIIPVISNPSSLSATNDRRFGLGDTTFTAFFTPKKTGSSGIVWGVGPTFYMPTATNDDLGTKKWGAGASAVVLKASGKWVFGGLASNIWDFAGPGNEKVNAFTFQPFVNYNMGQGWFLASVPIITANWEADDEHKWTIPVGAGIGKAMKMGNIPMIVQVHSYYNIETPDDYGEEWQMRFQIQWLFPR